MKYRTIFIQCLFLIGLAFCFLNYSSGAVSVLGQGNTGAPGDSGPACIVCHQSNNFGTTTSEIVVTPVGGGSPITSYTAGATYDLVVTINHTMGSPAAFGFQMTALDENMVDVADFSNLSSNAKISLGTETDNNNRRYAEHNMPSPTNTFTMQWTAPTTGTGAITFYHIGNSVNAAAGNNGDKGGSGETTVIQETVLPIELLAFEANQKNNTVLLTWQTESETNNAYFTIEHSLDGRIFESIAKIEGAGMSTSMQNYSYQHKKIVNGINYYRLKQTGFDGTFEYSNIITLKNKEREVVIYPNPVQDILSIDIHEEAATKAIRIFNGQGRLIKTIQEEQVNIDVADLHRGLYLLFIEFKDGRQLSHRFLKN